YIVVAVCATGILILTAGGVLLWWTGGSLLGVGAAAGAVGGAATIGEGAVTVSLGATVETAAGSTFTVSRLIAMARSADGLVRLGRLGANFRAAGVALAALQDGATLTTAQMAVLRGLG